MDFKIEIRAAESNPQQLETLFQTARREGQAAAFQSTMLACYDSAPGNLLYAAWFYRFQYLTAAPAKLRRDINWIAAVPLSLLTGLIFWMLSDFARLTVLNQVPQLLLWWSPLATMSALVFVAVTSRKNIIHALAIGVGLLAAAAYAILLLPTLAPDWKSGQYLILAIIHLPLLCWIGLGIAVLGFKSDTADRFAFLIKSIEVMITAGLYLLAGMVFGGITVGMFEALNITLPEIWLRLIVAGGFGLLPVLAVATVYDPHTPPSEQDFDQGLSRFIATMMRLLLPLTLGVLAVYLLVIPFNFLAPYNSRDVLIVYNLMLFGIIGLLIGATPIRGNDLSPGLQKWLCTGIIVVAILAEAVSLYALSAVIFRTVQGSLTPNRLAVIGWNSINIGILAWLIYRHFKVGREQWIESLQMVFSRATNAYLIWGLFLVVVVPLLF